MWYHDAAQSQLEQDMQEQQAQGNLMTAEQLAEFSRLEAQANAKTSKTKTALDTLATTQKASAVADKFGTVRPNTQGYSEVASCLLHIPSQI